MPINKPKGIKTEETVGGPKFLGIKEESPNKAHQHKDVPLAPQARGEAGMGSLPESKEPTGESQL